jgi:carbamoyl-phosphate synthase large subunit
MAIAYDDESLLRFLGEAARVSPGNPVLIDQFIEDAYEVDVDAVGDGEMVVIAGVMQHIEEAGIHSGDSACVLPPYKISLFHLSIIRDYTERLGQALAVRGLMNVQFAIKDDVVYVIEVNPRASRTVPFVSKATGVQVAKLAAKVQAGCTLAELGFTQTPAVDGFFVKEVALPGPFATSLFIRFAVFVSFLAVCIVRRFLLVFLLLSGITVGFLVVIAAVAAR